MYLADWEIADALRRGELIVDGLREGAIQPVSIDVHLGPVIKTETFDYEGDEKGTGWSEWNMEELGQQYLRQGTFFLASTAERFELSSFLVGNVRDKSTLARRGVFMSYGLVDPGFRGHVTLEFIVHSRHGITLTPGMPIGQITFESTPKVHRPYGHEALNSHYQDQEPTPQIARA